MALVVSASVLVVAEEGAECEVCVKVIDGLRKHINPKKASDKSYIEDRLEKYCKKVIREGKESKEASMCYYLTPIKRDVATPLWMGMPTLKACKRISTKDEMVCGLKFARAPAAVKKLSDEKINGMKVKSLKRLLTEFSQPCTGCSSREDYAAAVIAFRDAGKKEL